MLGGGGDGMEVEGGGAEEAKERDGELELELERGKVMGKDRRGLKARDRVEERRRVERVRWERDMGGDPVGGGW